MLKATNLQLWRGERHVLRGVSFEIGAGEAVKILQGEEWLQHIARPGAQILRQLLPAITDIEAGDLHAGEQRHGADLVLRIGGLDAPDVVVVGIEHGGKLRDDEQVDLAAAVDAFPGVVVAARSTASRSIFDTDLSGRVALLFGNEGGGLTAALRRKAQAEIAIPMPGGTESLNVAAAVAVCLYERVRQIAARRRGPQ